jgi:hypothetical protein
MRHAAVFLLLVVAGATCLAFWSTQRAGADGPCGTAHDAMDAEEFEFLELFQQWRDANLSNSSQLTPSGPLNAAAAWFAEYAAAGGKTGDGHQDNHGRDYFDRALDCGWPIYSGMGEGGVFTTTAAQAAAAMPYTHVGPFEAPDDPRYAPLKCVGVGRATVEGDTVWIVLIAQFPAGSGCPSAQTVAGPALPHTPETQPTTWRSWIPGVTAQ